jgi:ABC-2 type transport system ATP-binding protein
MIHANAELDARREDPVVAVQGLTKTFKDFWLRTRAKAVDNVTFHIDRGEIFGLLGPNGSGKSTTIKIMLGLLRQTSGRVAVFGKPPTDVAIKKRIGYLPEESYLYPFLNARETLDYYGKLFQLDYRTRRKRNDELLDMVGLTAVQHRAVREYSKGMQRRIGIAQALINDPEFLILDEPTTGLDPIGTRQIKDLILELGRRGKSILLSSHLLADVEDCVDRMVILYGGKTQRDGTCEQLLSASAGAVIETDDLDEGTLAEIDAVIRRRSGGERSILRVSKPRQKLEDLFVQIVEEARAKRLETSGAQHGGQTAGFLRATGDEGDALIKALVEAPVAPAAAEVIAASAPPEPAADVSMIENLTKAEPVSKPEPARPVVSAAKAPAGDQPAADLSMINALLGDGPGKPPAGPGGGGGSGGGGGGSGR